MMSPERLRAFHKNAYREAVRSWASLDRSTSSDTFGEETAYRVLEHAALWLRDSGDEGLPAELDRMTLDEKVRLVQAGCRSASGFSLTPLVDRILATELLEPEDIEEVEHILAQIDGFDAVVDIAVRLIAPALQNNDELLAELTRMRCLVAEMVEQLSKRPDVVTVASRFVLVQRSPHYLNDDRPADWFTRFREWDQEPSFADLAELSALSYRDGPVATPLRTVQLLSDRFGEIKSQGNQAALAASASQTPASIEQQLIDKRSRVDGDAALHANLQLLEEDRNLQLQLQLIGPTKDDYDSAELHFKDGTSQTMELSLACGRIELREAQIKNLTKLTIVDSAGNRRAVELN